LNTAEVIYKIQLKLQSYQKVAIQSYITRGGVYLLNLSSMIWVNILISCFLMYCIILINEHLQGLGSKLEFICKWSKKKLRENMILFIFFVYSSLILSSSSLLLLPPPFFLCPLRWVIFSPSLCTFIPIYNSRQWLSYVVVMAYHHTLTNSFLQGNTTMMVMC
jgi:hypothetical protein